MTATSLQAELGDGLAYTTVMTTLARLETKGVLTRRLSGRAYAYTLAGRPDEVEASLAAHRMRKVLDGRADRAGVLARFVADLSEEDEQLLISLLSDPAPAQGREPG